MVICAIDIHNILTRINIDCAAVNIPRYSSAGKKHMSQVGIP